MDEVTTVDKQRASRALRNYALSLDEGDSGFRGASTEYINSLLNVARWLDLARDAAGAIAAAEGVESIDA